MKKLTLKEKIVNNSDFIICMVYGIFLFGFFIEIIVYLILNKFCLVQ